MRALRLYAGPAARRHIERHGLQACDVGVIPAAAGGPKGLILGPLDRFIFGRWLPGGAQPVHLVGASIGAWRMAAGCLPEPVPAFELLEHGYIHSELKAPPGRRLPTPQQMSDTFAQNLRSMFDGRVAQILGHPRYRLHVLTSRGRHLLAREGRTRTAAGYLGAALSNAVHRRAMGAWLERVVFSGPAGPAGALALLPFAPHDYPTRQVALTPDNFFAAMQASGSIPFLLQAVHDIAGAPRGAYWDGGITDYHLHLHYRALESIATQEDRAPTEAEKGLKSATQPGALVLYPHFQRAVVPGWLDKPWRWRHRASRALDAMLVLAPAPEWVASLPGAKLPDRTDLQRLPAAERVRVWSQAVAAARQLADEFEHWLAAPDPRLVLAL